MAKKIIETWISRYGTPEVITTDRGRQFDLQLFDHFTKRLGVCHIRTSAYNPRANGLVERFHRQLKDSLRCLNQNNWLNSLPLALLGIRSAVKEDLKLSPAELVFGRPLRLPADITIKSASNATIDDIITFVQDLKSKLATHRPVSSRTLLHSYSPQVPKVLSTCAYVFLRTDAARKPLQRPYTGPYRVIKRNTFTFTIDAPNGPIDVAIPRLKPAQVDNGTVTFHLPRRRGRPRIVPD